PAGMKQRVCRRGAGLPRCARMVVTSRGYDVSRRVGKRARSITGRRPAGFHARRVLRAPARINAPIMLVVGFEFRHFVRSGVAFILAGTLTGGLRMKKSDKSRVGPRGR